SSHSPATSYQAAVGATLDTPPGAPDAPGILFFHPAAKRMAMMSAAGEVLLLAEDSIAGAFVHDAAGFGVFVTTPDGLQYQRLIRDKVQTRATTPARVLADPFVPRTTNNPDRPWVLIGPDPSGDPLRLWVLGMRLAEEPE
ncbi:MAG: hypothetical protein AAGB34_11480, partial [Planctomycetota bacterium]